VLAFLTPPARETTATATTVEEVETCASKERRGREILEKSALQSGEEEGGGEEGAAGMAVVPMLTLGIWPKEKGGEFILRAK